MQITVNISDEFAAEVQRRGLTPQHYVENLIAEKISIMSRSANQPRLNLEEFEASLDELTRYSDKIPSLSDQALSRRSLYSSD
jgi:hypothetical protein